VLGQDQCNLKDPRTRIVDELLTGWVSRLNNATKACLARVYEWIDLADFDASQTKNLKCPVEPKQSTAKCGDTVRQGGDKPESITIPVSGSSGDATLDYQTYDVPDQMQVFVDGKLAVDTGCVGNDRQPGSGSGSRSFKIPPGASNVRVAVSPNCAG